MKNYSVALVMLFLAFTTSAFAQKETKEAMVGTWKFASVNETKYNVRKANGTVNSTAQAQAENFKAVFNHATIVFNANNTFKVSGGSKTESGSFSIGQGDSMKYEVNGVVTLFYVDEVTPTKLVIRFEDSSILYEFSK